jgi:hyperpolarization activated cyclic nucleotide-gated potassium channel 2
MELLVEAIMVIDFLSRLVLRRTDWYLRNWLLHEPTPIPLLAIGSVPVSFIAMSLRTTINTSSLLIAYLRLFKLLRQMQIVRLSQNLEIICRGVRKVIFIAAELSVILFALTHFCAMVWLLVARHERDDGADDTWYDSWNEEDAAEYEEYIDGFFWATATMTSIGYGDIYPETDIERFISMFVMILGATMYGGLFGTFVVILDELSAEKRENRELLEQAS